MIISANNKAIRRRRIWRKTNGKCAHCGNTFYGSVTQTIDHFIPKSRGGGNDIKNLMPLCKKCNEERGCRNINPATYYVYADKKSIRDCIRYKKIFYAKRRRMKQNN